MSETEKRVGGPTSIERPSKLDSGGRLDVFADDRQRRVVTYLAECDAPTAFDDLVVALAATETETPPDELDEEATKSVAIALHHVHLPKLLQEGFVRAHADGLVLDVADDALDGL